MQPASQVQVESGKGRGDLKIPETVWGGVGESQRLEP